MIRRTLATIRVTPLLALTATTAALVAFVVQHPTAAVWAVVVALVLALAAMVTLVVEINDTTEWANAAEHRAVQAEHLVDALDGEAQATHAANEILCAELACSDQIIHRLSNDLLAAHKRISDAENVIPLPVVRDGSRDDLAALDAEATEFTWPSIAREAFPVREWGEEAEK